MKAKFVAALAEMKIGHRSDKANLLPAFKDLVISGWAVRPKLSLRNQTAIMRFDHPLCLMHRHKVVLIEHLGCAHGHHFDETENQTPPRCEFYQWN
jgi:hypothetical protein